MVSSYSTSRMSYKISNHHNNIFITCNGPWLHNALKSLKCLIFMVCHETMNTSQPRNSLPTETERTQGMKSDNADHNMRPNRDPKETNLDLH